MRSNTGPIEYAIRAAIEMALWPARAASVATSSRIMVQARGRLSGRIQFEMAGNVANSSRESPHGVVSEKGGPGVSLKNKKWLSRERLEI